MLRMKICTSVGLGWAVVTALCVTSQAYAPPLNIATGPQFFPEADGYLRVGPDEYGSWVDNTFGGIGDVYDPAGSAGAGLGPRRTTFTNGFMIFFDPLIPSDCCTAHPTPGCDDAVCSAFVCANFNPFCCDVEWLQPCADFANENCGCAPSRELLSDAADWQGVGCAGGTIGDDTTLDRLVTGANVASDTNADGVDDMLTSSFEVTGAGINLQFDLVQKVEGWAGSDCCIFNGSPGCDDPDCVAVVCAADPFCCNTLWDQLCANLAQELCFDVCGGFNSNALLTQTYTITNNGAGSATFKLLRLGDFDLVWNFNDPFDDSVGTDSALTHNEVFQQEDGLPATRITMISPDAVAYTGGIQGITPTDGPPAYGFGTDCQQWDAGGMPATWANYIANVGYDTDGESGANPPGCGGCDAFINLETRVVTLAPGGSDTITVSHVYGASSSKKCQWDCGGDNDGNVGIVDFLALLSDWGGPSACDFDGGGVGIIDFLKLLANWGPCP